MRGGLQRLAAGVKNVGFVLGFRPDYKVENLLATIALAVVVIGWLLVGQSPVLAVVGSILLLTPLILQLYSARRGLRRSVLLPLYVVLASALASLFMPILVIPAIVNALFVEDFTVFLEVDVVTIKRTLRVLVAPVARRELLVLIASTALASVASYLLTRSPLVLIYPVISYIMIAYSLILVPPQYRPPERGRTLLEELSRRVALLYFLFNKLYSSPGMRRLAKEAGLFGHNYDRFIKRMGGLFTLVIYLSLSVAPLLSILIGNYALVIPVVAGAVMFAVPYLMMSGRKRRRAGKISRNQLLILSYLASMKSVSESFTDMMLNLKSNPNLARLFGLEDEAKLYHQIFMAKGVESIAVREYADSIPDDFYRDTIRTMQDIEENEGVGAAFKMLVARLRDYTGRYIDRVSTLFENIGGNIISVIMLVETALPIMMFLSSPLMLPVLMFAGGVLSGIVMYGIASGVLPDLPSEYVNTKPRYRRASLLFILTILFLVVLERLLTPQLLAYELLLNVPVGLGIAVWYASADDMRLNRMLLEKFPDLLVLFTSSLSRHNSVERAMLELSQQPTFPQRLRAEFKKLARIFTYINVQKINYRGPYWYKYLLFLASISSVYGVTPRELYKTISNFMLEFKRFFSLVRNFGMSMLFMAIIALSIMTMEMNIAFQFLEISQTVNIERAASQMGIESPLPSLSTEEISALKLFGYVSLLMVAIINGVGLAKIVSGTARDGRYALLLYVLELILLYVAEATGFGIRLGAG